MLLASNSNTLLLENVAFHQDQILLTVYVFFSGGPRLKGQDVVVHFLKIIKNPNYNQHIGVEYCKLLKSAISVPVYQCDISVKTWQGIHNEHYFSFLIIRQRSLLRVKLWMKLYTCKRLTLNHNIIKRKCPYRRWLSQIDAEGKHLL